jgi:hypothetical protein
MNPIRAAASSMTNWLYWRGPGLLLLLREAQMTTYVLGAGASVHAGYPLAADLGNKLRAWTSRNRPEGYDYWTGIDELHALYGGLGNIEEILTDLDDPPSGSRASGLDPSVRERLLRNFLVALREFFDHLSMGHATLYRCFARERVRKDDVFITFNYDAELERELKKIELWEIGDGYGFPIELPRIPRSKVTVLKLHGSINWFGLIMGGILGASSPPSTFGSRPVILRQRDLEYLGYPAGVHDPQCAGATIAHAAPGIILPLHHKRFYWKTIFGSEWEPFWNDLWEQAGCALQSSEGIVIIGYGMANVDERARTLLLENANRHARITLFCRQRTIGIRDEFAAHGFQHVETPGDGTFERYLGE